MKPLTPSLQAELDECIKLEVETMKATKKYKFISVHFETIAIVMEETATQMGELNFYYKHPELLISDDEVRKGAKG